MPSSAPTPTVLSSARADGAKVGILWIISFALFIGNFRYPLCGLLWLFTMVFTPFYVGILTKSFADSQPDGKVSYGRAYSHSMMTVFYASLLLALAQWVYLQYIDKGFLIDRYASMLTDKELTTAMERMGYPKGFGKEMATRLREMRPIDIVLQLLWSNMVAGMVLSVTTALYASVRSHWK